MRGEAKYDLSMVALTLQCMARGGIHDHVGGGFHRYSVDECWHGQLVCKSHIISGMRLFLVFWSASIVSLQYLILRRCYTIKGSSLMFTWMFSRLQKMCSIQVRRGTFLITYVERWSALAGRYSQPRMQTVQNLKVPQGKRRVRSMFGPAKRYMYWMAHSFAFW